MKSWRMMVFLLLALVLAGSTACNPFDSKEQGIDSELVKVTRDDLTVTVSGSGRIEASSEAELVFGIGGRIDRIYVEEGAKVNKGVVLANLKTDDLELAVTQTQVALTQAQLAQLTAEYELEEAQDLYAEVEIYQARQATSEARQYLEYAQSQQAQASTAWDIRIWTNEVAYAKEKLRAAEVRLNNLLSTPDTKEIAIRRLQLEATKQSLELAEQSLEQAQRQLDEAPIIAPFDGVVAKVYADEGDVIPSLTLSPIVIIHLVDTTAMELEVEVDEIDITEVKPGQSAIIEVDALPSLQLEGKVNSIGLLPIEAGGVIVYNVKIEFTASEDIGLRAGMSTSADIIITERKTVLVVPDRAIKQGREGTPVVEVMVKGQIEERPVVTGISDGFQTEVVSGLEEGEVVVRRVR
ncbi:efflux RND transporter periplasmic adaptor subunit [Chloroflexota bacterium]